MRDARDHIRCREPRAIEEEHEGDRDVGRDLHRRSRRRPIGGAKLASDDGRDEKHGERVGRKRERVWRMMAAICLDFRSFGMTFADVSVIMFRDDRDLRSRPARDLPGRGRDRLVLGGRAAAGPAPVDGEPAGAPARSGDAPASVRPRHPQRLADRRWAGLDRACGRDSRRLFAGRALFLERRAAGAGCASAPRRISLCRASCRRFCAPSRRGILKSTSR